MPGVSVTTSARSGPSGPVLAASGQLFIAGLSERGDSVEPVLINGLADFEELFGERVSYGWLWDSVKLFFEEGGRQAYIARVVGPAASVGTQSLVDRAGSPLPTLKIDAKGAGSYSTRISVAVANGAIADTFRIEVYFDDELVEVKTNLASPSAAVAAFATSAWINVTNLGSATAAPNNNPTVAAADALSAGSDDRAAVTASHYVEALARFTKGLGDGAVAIPGIGSTVHAGLVEHAEEHNRIALLASVLGDDKTDYVALAGTVDSDAAGLCAPWLLVTDGVGGTRFAPPEGYVAGCRATAHETVGPWRAAAGLLASSRSVLGVETDWTEDDANDLDTARVNVIRVIAGSVRNYGWRSLSSDEENFYFLSARDLLNRLVVDGEKRLEDYVFAPIDDRGQILSAVNATLVGMLEPIRQANGLFGMTDADGTEIDKGYLVETGASINSRASLQQNRIKARISVRMAPTGAFVELTIVKVGLSTGL